MQYIYMYCCKEFVFLLQLLIQFFIYGYCFPLTPSLLLIT